MTDRSRKVLIRVIGAPLLLAALGAILYLDHRSGKTLGLQWLVAAVATISSIEFFALCRGRGVPVAGRAATLFLAASLGGKALLNSLDAWTPFLRNAVHFLPSCLVLYVLLKLVFRHGRFTVEGAALTVLGYAYVDLLRYVLIPAGSLGPDTYYLLFLVAANKGSDVAAYVVGKSVGRRRMAPVLSPGKTWEGFAGGAVGGTVAGAAFLLSEPLRGTLTHLPAAALLFVAFLVTMAAQVGDLVESAFKRWAGVKDSGRLIPEFGGMLDMVDSFLISAPVAHYALMFLGSLYSR